MSLYIISRRVWLWMSCWRTIKSCCCRWWVGVISGWQKNESITEIHHLKCHTNYESHTPASQLYVSQSAIRVRRMRTSQKKRCVIVTETHTQFESFPESKYVRIVRNNNLIISRGKADPIPCVVGCYFHVTLDRNTTAILQLSIIPADDVLYASDRHQKDE